MLEKLLKLARTGKFTISDYSEIQEIGFENAQKIKHLIIEKDLDLPTMAFYHLNNLETVKFLKGVKKLPMGCFSGCNSLERVSGLESVESVGDFAFSYCTNLKDVSTLKKVKSVGEYAFFNNFSLKMLELGADLTDIKRFAFANCESLLELNIRADINKVKLGEMFLFNCKKLQKLVLNKNSYYSVFDNIDICNEKPYFNCGLDNITIKKCLHTRDTNKYKNWHNIVDKYKK